MHLNFRSQYKFWALADGCMSAIRGRLRCAWKHMPLLA